MSQEARASYKELRIREGHVIRPATVLAPMAGVTDTVFRRLIRGFGGCGLLMTEFTSADGLMRETWRTRRYLLHQRDEHPIAAQLFGANPDTLADAAAMCEELGFDQVDLNLGCSGPCRWRRTSPTAVCRWRFPDIATARNCRRRKCDLRR